MQGTTIADCTLLLLDRRYLLIKADDVRFFALPALVIAITLIMQSPTAKSPIRLSWTHYNIIQQELTAD